MSSVYRGVGSFAWLIAFSLSVWLAVEFHEYHPGISLGVAILALILSAFGLNLARDCWRRRDYFAMSAGSALWVAGVIAFAITELGFWSSSYKDRHDEYVKFKAAETRIEGLKDQDWSALLTGEVRASSAEVEAKIKAAEQHARWSSSEQCTNATVSESRAFCQGYFDLQSELARASKLEVLEKRLIAENITPPNRTIYGIFSTADMLADNSGISHKQAATIVIVTLALMLMLARDLLLIVANPFGGAAGKRVTRPDLERKPAGIPEFVASPRKDAQKLSRPSPTDGGGGKPKPDVAASSEGSMSGEAGDPEKVIYPKQFEGLTKGEKRAEKRRKKRLREERRESKKDELRDAVEAYIAECVDLQSEGAEIMLQPPRKGCAKPGWLSGGTHGREMRDDFRKWSITTEEFAHLQHSPDNMIGQAFCYHLKVAGNGKGTHYEGLIIDRQEMKRKVA